MIDPGVSLFSGGAEALQLTDNQNQREEEEEALEDQRRRDQEVLCICLEKTFFRVQQHEVNILICFENNPTAKETSDQCF